MSRLEKWREHYTKFMFAKELIVLIINDPDCRMTNHEHLREPKGKTDLLQQLYA